jgi:hypothetical protein
MDDVEKSALKKQSMQNELMEVLGWGEVDLAESARSLVRAFLQEQAAGGGE